MKDTRQRLLDAAVELISENGLAGCTQPRVAQRAELRQSNLTYYFPSRKALLAAVAHEAVIRRVAAFAAIEAQPNLNGKIDSLAVLLTDDSQTRVLLALVQIADQNSEVRSAFGALRAGALSLARDLIKDSGSGPNPTAEALLQSTSTGIAVLALANSGQDMIAVASANLRALLSLPTPDPPPPSRQEVGTP